MYYFPVSWWFHFIHVSVKLSSMVRDMSMDVRVEAFQALGKTESVSGYILLQTLSKKVLTTVKEKKCSFQGSLGQLTVLVSSAAGAILHGLEDEYHEVILFSDSW